MEKDRKRRPNIRQIVEILKEFECSVRKDGSDGEEQSETLLHPEWHEALDIIVSGSAEQSIEALKAICRDLKDLMNDTSRVLPEYIIEAADRLVSCLTLLVQKTFSTNIVGSSSKHRKYTINTLLQVFRTRNLACAVKMGTLEELVTEILIWIVKMDNGSQQFQVLNVLVVTVLANTDRTSSFVILINLLRPLEPSRWPSCTALELIAEKNNGFSHLVWKCLFLLKEDLESSIHDLDLDLILQSIHAFIEPLGIEELAIRVENCNMPELMVLNVLHDLVKLVGSKIKGHLSIFSIDHEAAVPIILTHIDFFLQEFAKAARTSVPPTGQTSHGADAASNSTNPSTHSPSEIARMLWSFFSTKATLWSWLR